MAQEFDEYEYLEKQLEKRYVNDDRDERRRDKHSSRDRERSRDKDHERGKDGRKRRSRSRSRSKSKDYRRREEKDKKRRSRSPKRKERTPPEVREAREKQRELEELDRDTRTVFASNLPLKADERDLFEFFSKAGKLVDVKIIMDRNTRKSKGFAYIEFARKEDIVNAIALTGQLLMGQPVMVKMSEAEKNLAWEAAQQQQQQQAKLAAAGAGTGPCKLAISNVHPGLSETDLQSVFDSFGPVDFITLQRDATGRSLGYGYVQYRNMADATRALTGLDGEDIVGQRLQVKIASVSTAETVMGPNIDELVDEEEGGGLKLTSHARAALMSRLASSAGVAVPAPTTGNGFMGFGGAAASQAQPAQPSAVGNALSLEQGFLGPASPIPTNCVLLKNMFDPATETEPYWDQDIAGDVKEECSKFGEVIHVHVDRNSKGYVYLKFATVEGASAAQKALNGRWFAGRQIAADFQFMQVYNQHFSL